MIHPTPTQTLLTTTFEPLVMQLSSSLTRGARIINQFVQAAPTPEATMAFELELDTLLREVGRRIMAWTLNQVEPEADAEAPARLEYNGYLYRRRRQPPRSVATLFGPVTLRRRLYERLGRSGSGRSVHPLELGLGLEAGLRRLSPSGWAASPLSIASRKCERCCKAIMGFIGPAPLCAKSSGVCGPGWLHTERAPRSTNS